MFRPMRRRTREISPDQASELLRTERRGIVAVNGEDGYPFAFPINYLYDAEANKIYFHGAKKGLKVESLAKSDKVCFTVMGNERREPAEEWAPYVQSAVVYGRCKAIEDAEPFKDLVKRFALKYYPSADQADAEISKSLKAMALYEISIEHVCGKEVQEE